MPFTVTSHEKPVLPVAGALEPARPCSRLTEGNKTRHFRQSIKTQLILVACIIMHDYDGSMADRYVP